MSRKPFSERRILYQKDLKMHVFFFAFPLKFKPNPYQKENFSFLFFKIGKSGRQGLWEALI